MIKPELGQVWVLRDGRRFEVSRIGGGEVYVRQVIEPNLHGTPFIVTWGEFARLNRLEGSTPQPMPQGEIVPGSVVRLRCGGPWMCVELVGETTVDVIYHDNEGRMITAGMVLRDCINLVPEEQLADIA